MDAVSIRWCIFCGDHVLFMGMDKDPKRWVENYTVVVDLLYSVLSDGGKGCRCGIQRLMGQRDSLPGP